jgi:single-strand DNA-binding protein
MSSVNKAFFIGRVASEPEVREAGAHRVVNFRMALDESYKDKNGVLKEKVEFVSVCAWNKLADICAKYLKKGAQVYVETKVTTESYEKNGVRLYSTKFVASAVEFISQRSDEETTEPEDDGFNF